MIEAEAMLLEEDDESTIELVIDEEPAPESNQ